jgi:peptidoglycan/LPS O-acetylase OafA/YrhL
MTALTVAYLIGVRVLVGPAASMSEVKWMYFDDAVPARLAEFGMGMFVAWLLANRPVGKAAIRATVVAVPIGLVVARLRWPIDFGIRSLIYGVVFALVLLAAAAPHQNILRTVLSSRLLRWVGQCSYSLYLFHLPFVAFVCTLALRWTRSEAAAFFFSLPFIVLIVLAAHLSYLVFERPFMRAKRPAPSTSRPGSVAAAGAK